MIYLNEPHATVSWDDAVRCVYFDWRGVYVDGEAFRKVLETAREVLAQKRACRSLSDARRMKVITPDDQAWIEKDWLPRMRRAGMKYSAVVIPTSALAQISVRYIERNAIAAGNLAITQHFDTPEKAKQWLLAQPD